MHLDETCVFIDYSHETEPVRERKANRQTETDKTAETDTDAEVQKQRHRDKGKQGVNEDWVRMSSFNAFCYFNAIDANAMIVFFRIMFQLRYCR